MSTSNEAVPGWSGWYEMAAVVTYRPHLKRTVTVALTVGTVFFAMNQLMDVLAGNATLLTWLKVALTYLTPFCMSNFGILTATRQSRDRRLGRSSSAAGKS
ncbi:MAG: hypothetical protein E6G56_00775 [Actinobacteria bacterium]|nr:MAG: hypothetical protein E6G56_00775 [Actinomycetota bacterium]